MPSGLTSVRPPYEHSIIRMGRQPFTGMSAFLLIEVDGIATMDISIGEQKFHWDAFVAPIKDEGIIGYDFLYFFDCILEARSGIRIAQ